MKKIFGFLLILIGTGLIIWGVWAASNWSSMVLIVCGVLGVAFILKGRKLYLVNGESPKAKIVAGRFLIIIGLGLVVFGTLWHISEGWDNYNRAGDMLLVLVSLVAALGFLIAGMVKVRSGKKAAHSSAQNTKENTMQDSASSKKKTPDPPPQPKMMVCQECGKKYPLSQVYCDECGSLLKET